MRYFHRSLLVVPRVLTLQTFLWNTALSCPIQPLVTWFMDELVVKFCSSVWNRQNRDLSYQDVSMLCSLFEQNARSDARTELEETHHFYRYLLSFVSRWLLYPKIKISKTDPAQAVKRKTSSVATTFDLQRESWRIDAFPDFSCFHRKIQCEWLLMWFR